MKTKLLFPLLSITLFVTACATEQPSINSIEIDSSNNVIIDYDNSSSEVVGKITDSDIVDHITSITMSPDGYYIVNGIKTNIKVGFSEITINEDGYYVVNGITTKILATNSYKVSFDTGTTQKVKDQKVLEGYKVERPDVSRTGYTLDGWYCNDEEWRFNSDVVLNDMTLEAKWTANKYTVSFINEKGVNPDDLIVTYDTNYVLPSVSNVDGYTFAGWYKGQTKYTGGKWNYASDLELTAKWTTNEYTITLDPGEGSVSKNTVKVTYGENYTLPIPTNDYGVFVGWLCDGVAVTDSEGHSLAPWTYLENKTLTVEWTIEISSVLDMNKLHTYKEGSFVLANDINMLGQTWIPVSDFRGRLDGNNHSIIGLGLSTVSLNLDNNYGLFSSIRGAIIENLNMVGFTFASTNTSQSLQVGAITARTASINSEISVIRNCSVSGTMSIASQSGSYPISAGGLCGLACAAEFYDCTNNIEIPSSATYGGGIAGKSIVSCKFKGCKNNANVSAQVDAGGMLGGIYQITLDYLLIEECGNEGNISANNNAGGLVGNGGMACNISRSYNHGSVHASTSNAQEGAGGLVGSAYEVGGSSLPYARITESYNTGSVSNTKYSGGLVGATYQTEITQSYNSGSVSASDLASGLVGFGPDPTVRECVSSGSLSATLKCTLVHYLTSITYSDCYHTYTTGDSYFKKEGTKITDSSQLSDKNFYKNSLYWQEYNPLSGNGTWVFIENELPKLAIEYI